MTKTKIGFGDYLYGYVGGERFLVENSIEQICSFIMKFRFEDVRIVNILDVREIETSMGFIMYCENQEFLAKDLIPVLAPMQTGEKEVPEFVPYVIKDYLIENVRLKGEQGYYLGTLDFQWGNAVASEATEYYKTEEELKELYPDSKSDEEAFEIASESDWI